MKSTDLCRSALAPFTAAVFTAAVFACGTLPCVAESAESSKKIAFELSDYRGKSYQAADFADAKVVVFVALGTECPLAQLYTGTLQQIADRFASQQVVMVGVNANRQDSLTEIAAYARQHELTFPILKDTHATLVDQLGLTRTPEVAVLNADGKVVYRGRIDDRFGIGYGKDAPTKTELIDAISQTLEGKPVSEAEVPAVGCLIARHVQSEGEPAASAVTYTGDVATILNTHCVNCHRPGEIAPFALTDYESASGWSEMIAEVVSENRMPPWHAADAKSTKRGWDGVPLNFSSHATLANARGLSAAEKETLILWAKAGAPRGEGNEPQAKSSEEVKLPEEDEWHLPRKPDAVFTMAKKPFSVPAEGVVKYQYFQVDPQITSDRWVQGVEVIPGNRAVVHHVLVFAYDPLSGERVGEGTHGFLAAYVPGLEPAVYPDRMAKKIPAGSRLIFQVHYTPIGTEQTDLSKVGFLYADEEDVDFLVETRSAVGRRLHLEPQKKDQKIEAADVVRDSDATLLAMMPHMHLRGQAFRYTLNRDGERETLLEIPAYDFNWQTGYGLQNPLPLKKGDRIECIGWFDNSPDNLANPDPTAHVRWGDQTWDEMMIGYYDVAVPVKKADSKAAAGDGKLDLRDAEGQPVQTNWTALKRMDRNGDDKLSADEVPDRFRALHRRLDRNGDGLVDATELRPIVRE